MWPVGWMTCPHLTFPVPVCVHRVCLTTFAASPCRFVTRFQSILTRCEAPKPAAAGEEPRQLRVAVVGGGAGGVEVAMAMQHRLDMVWKAAAQEGTSPTLRPQVT